VIQILTQLTHKGGTMKTNIKKKWIEALKSGKYTQTDRALKDSQGHCCLGVLCDIFLAETGRGIWNAYNEFEIEDYPSTESLPIEVQEWAGIDSPLGSYGENDHDTLAHAHDYGLSFEVGIPTLIEEHF